MPLVDDGRLYYPKPLLTGSERRFLDLLQEAVPEHYVFPQVCMGAIIDPPGYFHGYQRVQARIPYQSKMVDFIIYDSKANKIVCLVELDDYSHDEQKERDHDRDAMTAEAGYATVRVDGRQLPDRETLRHLIRTAKVPRKKNAKAPRPPLELGETVRWLVFWAGLLLAAALLGTYTWVILPDQRAPESSPPPAVYRR